MKGPDTAFRAHNPAWADTPTSGFGASQKGGRFNRQGVEALYLSLKYEVAVREASQGFAQKMQPLTIVQYELDCDDIVDLREPEEQARWGAPMDVLRSPWELLAARGSPVPTWELADRMQAAGVAGILVQSFALGARKGDTNLVLWKWGPTPPHKCVEIDDEGRLKKR